MTSITTSDVYRTGYQRADCNIGLVHIGYGAFHRAHQAVYVDDYMHHTGELNWGIAAVNLRASESAAFEKSASTDDGYLLKTTSPKGESLYRLVRSHIRYEDWSRRPENAEHLLALETVHAVSITVTESGYYLDESGNLDVEHPVIAAEIAGSEQSSVYAYLANSIKRRVAKTGAPLSILCCDNIRSNGKMLERNFGRYLELTGRVELAEWTRQHASFPCSMVDRITPRTTDALYAEIRDQFPGRHVDPVHGESFIQWVLERNFAGPAPELDKVGVEIVADVDPYEEAKIRILNGGHTCLAYLGALSGHRTFDKAIQDPVLRAHFDRWQDDEVLPGITIELPFDKVSYRNEIAARFCNSAIADTLERICMDGYSKFPLFITPTLSSCLAQGIEPTAGYDTIASWYIYARQFAAGQMPVAYQEPAWDTLSPLLKPGQEAVFAQQTQLWSDLPETHSAFVPGIVNAIKNLEEKWPA